MVIEILFDQQHAILLAISLFAALLANGQPRLPASSIVIRSIVITRYRSIIITIDNYRTIRSARSLTFELFEIKALEKRS